MSKPIAGWIRQRIIQLHRDGMSQADMVLRLGVHRNTVSLIVREYRKAQALGVNQPAPVKVSGCVESVGAANSEPASEAELESMLSAMDDDGI